jgi:hypothetical protein
MAIAEPDKEKTSKKDLLRGPDITAPSHDLLTPVNPDSDSMMDNQMEHPKKPLLLRDYFSALKHSNRSDLGDKLAITNSQREQIKHIISEHQAAMKVFQSEHAAEIREIREKMKAAAKERRANKQSDTNERGDKVDQPMRDKLRKMIDNAPPNKQAVSKLKQVLSESQFELLTKSIHERRAKRNSQTAERQRNQRTRSAQKDMNSDTAERSAQKRANRSKQGLSSSDD